MSYKLEYPYTEDERLEFIVKYNHDKGLKIETVDNFVEVEIVEVLDETNEETSTITKTETRNMPTYYALEANEIMVDNEPVIDPDYEAKQEQAERERIQELFMTRSDFFDGTIDAWGVDEDMLKPLLINMVNNLPLDDRLKLKALNNFKNALNFYRKHALFNMLVNTPIQLTETTRVILTDESLDKYFDEVAKGNKATAWKYLPQPIAIPIETDTTEKPLYDDV